MSVKTSSRWRSWLTSRRPSSGSVDSVFPLQLFSRYRHTLSSNADSCSRSTLHAAAEPPDSGAIGALRPPQMTAAPLEVVQTRSPTLSRLATATRRDLPSSVAAAAAATAVNRDTINFIMSSRRRQTSAATAQLNEILSAPSRSSALSRRCLST